MLFVGRLRRSLESGAGEEVRQWTDRGDRFWHHRRWHAIHSLAREGAKGFGLPARPGEVGEAYRAAKGDHDIATRLIALVILAKGFRRALGWVSLAAVMMPASDSAIVLRHKGFPAVAFGVHGATAALVLAIAWLLLNEDECDI